MATPKDILNWFTYHAPTPDQTERYQKLRDLAFDYGMAIVELTPSCADQTAALRMLRETSMAVNQAIACNEAPTTEAEESGVHR